MCWRFGIDYPLKIKAIQRYRPEYIERWSCLLRSRKGDSFIHIDLHTWWWKRLQEACEVHSSSFLECPQSCWWVFWHFRWCSQSPHFSSGHKSWKLSWCAVILSLCVCVSLSKKRRRKKEERKKRKRRRTNKLVDWSVGGTWHKSVNSRCLYCINGEWVPVATKIMNLLKKSQPPCLKLLEAKWGEGRQDIIRAETMVCNLLVIKTCNHPSPWIYWCF